MKSNTKKLSLCAIFTALQTMFVYLSAVIPAGRLGIIGLASLTGVAAVVEVGVKWYILVYAASSVLSLFIVPDKASFLVFALFFGFYPAVKSVAEKLSSRLAEYMIKLAVFNAALILVMLTASKVIFEIRVLNFSRAVMFAVLNAVFLIFDFGVSRAAAYYCYRISPKVNAK